MLFFKIFYSVYLVIWAVCAVGMVVNANSNKINKFGIVFIFLTPFLGFMPLMLK